MRARDLEKLRKYWDDHDPPRKQIGLTTEVYFNPESTHKWTRHGLKGCECAPTDKVRLLLPSKGPEFEFHELLEFTQPLYMIETVPFSALAERFLIMCQDSLSIYDKVLEPYGVPNTPLKESMENPHYEGSLESDGFENPWKLEDRSPQEDDPGPLADQDMLPPDDYPGSEFVRTHILIEHEDETMGFETPFPHRNVIFRHDPSFEKKKDFFFSSLEKKIKENPPIGFPSKDFLLSGKSRIHHDEFYNNSLYRREWNRTVVSEAVTLWEWSDVRLYSRRAGGTLSTRVFEFEVQSDDAFSSFDGKWAWPHMWLWCRSLQIERFKNRQTYSWPEGDALIASCGTQ
jgi:hypothetical protein